jgi:ATP-dependent DNA ligase
MEAKLVDAVPSGSGWQFEPKWDGFRCLAFRDGGEIHLQAKSGKPLTRYFPEVVEMLASLPARRFVLDGELAVPVAGIPSFDALQMRLHPAESRIRKLAASTPAIFIVFDILFTPESDDLLKEPLRVRRRELERFVNNVGGTSALTLSPRTLDVRTARSWLARSGGALDGVIAKRLDEPYRPGERAMLKIKRRRTADCVVAGFRYGQGTRLVASLLLGLYNDEGKLDHVGFTSTIANADRAALTRRLERLIGPPGFTGKAPGGPSRWSTERSGQWQPLKPKLVVEVLYDQVTDDRFRHGTRLLRWRPDKAPRQCTFSQIERPGRPPRMLGAMRRAKRPRAVYPIASSSREDRPRAKSLKSQK